MDYGGLWWIAGWDAEELRRTPIYVAGEPRQLLKILLFSLLRVSFCPPGNFGTSD